MEHPHAPRDRLERLQCGIDAICRDLRPDASLQVSERAWVKCVARCVSGHVSGPWAPAGAHTSEYPIPLQPVFLAKRARSVYLILRNPPRKIVRVSGERIVTHYTSASTGRHRKVARHAEIIVSAPANSCVFTSFEPHRIRVDQLTLLKCRRSGAARHVCN